MIAKKTEYALKVAGWNDARSINIDAVKEYLVKNGQYLSPIIETFIQSFANLKIQFQNGPFVDAILIDPIEAVKGIDPRWLDDYRERIGNANVCIIGLAYSEHLTMFMDDTGSVYGGYDENLYLVGTSGIDAIDALVSRRKERIID